MAKEGFMRSITRRFRRVKSAPTLDPEKSAIITEAVEEAKETPPEPPPRVSWKKETYKCGGKEFVHITFRRELYRKDPISRTFKLVDRGKKTTSYYAKDGKLLG